MSDKTDHDLHNNHHNFLCTIRMVGSEILIQGQLIAEEMDEMYFYLPYFLEHVSSKTRLSYVGFTL